MDQQIYPPTTASANKKSPVALIIKIIILALIIIAVFLAGEYIGKKNEQQISQASRDALVKGIFSRVIVNSLAGEITGIAPDKKSITVSVKTAMGSVNIPEEYQTKNVLITPQTRIILTTQKSADQYSKEMAQFRTGKNFIMASPPLPFEQKTVTVDDLKQGNQISFSFMPDNSTNGILNNEISATEIDLAQVNLGN